MMLAKEFSRLAVLVERERERLAARDLETTPESAELRLDEIRTSCALAGVEMTRAETAGLALRGMATSARPLDDLILVADYAASAAFVAAAAPARGRRRYLTIDEIVEVHARALRRVPSARPGTWRGTTIPAFASGVVAPPPWLVAREVAAFAERFAPGPAPEESALLWVATAHERFLRIRPFARGNGRTSRLVANLLLRRLRLPPFFVPSRERVRYERALASADARELLPLGILMARSSLTSLRRLAAKDPEGERFAPLADLTEPHEREALYKAAQRGRLRSIRSAHALLTTRESIEAYRASRATTGRKALHSKA